MNSRIKEVRKFYDLSQEKFGKKLGVTKAAISRMELGTYNVTDTMIKLICSEFNVNEEWLRTGDKSLNMFNDPDELSLDEYAKQHNVSDLELDIIKLYFELDSDTRRGLLKYFKEELLKDKLQSKSKQEHDENTSSNDPTIEELEEEYKKRHSKSVSKTEVSASNGIGGDKNKVI